MKHIHFILLSILLSTTFNSYCQDNKQLRIEFESKDGYENEEIHTFGKTGFILSSSATESENGEKEWRYELYNSNLVSTKTNQIQLKKKFYNVVGFRNDNYLFDLYKDKKNNFSFVSVKAEGLKIDQVEGKFPKKTIVSNMVVLKDKAFLNVRIKSKATIIIIDRETGSTSLVPIIIGKYSSKKLQISRIQELENINEVLVFVKVQTKRKKNEMYLIRLNGDGEIIDTILINEDIKENIISISGSNIADDEYIITGTYSRVNTTSSEGIFFGKLSKGKLEFLKFYTFTKMKEFFSYMSDKTKAKVEKKIEKKEKKGKELVLNYLIADHKVMQIGDDFLFLGEAYYPTYREERYTTTRVVNGVSKTVTEYRTVFDGYQYTHATLSKFDKEGNMLWDQAFEMYPNHKPFYVKRFISISELNNEKLELIFSNGGRIISKSFNFDGEVIEERKSESIQTVLSGDQVRLSYSNINFWYDNYFLAYGHQVIKNKEDKTVKKKRIVFFIARIEF